ncbi:short-chain dehydrogenase/reductase [Undibacterium terreum]|uniref:Short-chain dehydrogenase/reductase n=2 Tax=Undibacterium terreum TaxID=1224302 RepID=A0A916UNR5_9BURK|nr:short-chain dehydrogenase/reductase [Undibacterium terreum]
MMNTGSSKIFLITGVSSGLGKAFAQAAISAGHRVVGTVRDEQARAAFEAMDALRAKAVILDVSHFDAVEPTLREALQAIGEVDVLVNNAGYGHEGTLEESPLAEMQRQFDVNVFGAVAVIKAVLPGMRKRRSGHIINVTSMAGMVTFPGIAYYSGSKFALEGISEALAKELKGFGIKVTAFAPGSFRTDWAGRSMVRSSHSIADYDAVFNPVRRARQSKSGKQAGDPAKAAQALLHIVAQENPPTHLVLGKDALKLVREKISKLSEEINAWEAVSLSTDFE